MRFRIFLSSAVRPIRRSWWRGALALTDVCSLAGIVRAHAAAKEHALHLIAGTTITLACGLRLVLLARTRAGYAQLSRLITTGRLAASKGDYHLTRQDLTANGLADCFLLWLPDPGADTAEQATWLQDHFPGDCRIAVERTLAAGERCRLHWLARLSRESSLPRVAVGGVRMHVRGRRALALRDVRRALGLSADDPQNHRALVLAEQLVGFPRHLSQHVGGLVIARGPLAELVPVENAAMAGRQVIQWDKDDLDAVGLLKIDCLSLGMLTVLQQSFRLIATHYGRSLTLANLPRDDPAVFNMIQRADTVGVFQIESRAQMSMLPRLKPRNFYDLVIEMAMVGAGFTPGEADQLRRSMAAW